VHIGLWEHRVDNKFTDLSDFDNVKHAKLTYRAGLGVCPGRINALTLYDQEDFIFQIDAHMIFDTHWDIKILQNYFKIQKEKQIDKLIISGFPAWWNYKKNKEIFLSHKPNAVSVTTYNWKPDIKEVTIDQLLYYKQHKEFFGRFYYQTKDGQYIGLICSWFGVFTETFDTWDKLYDWISTGHNDSGRYPQIGVETKDASFDYYEHQGWLAHFVFSRPEVFFDILPDPLIMFGGEEPTLALRAWTRGYRTFMIKEHILWHLNKNDLDDPEDRSKNPGDPILIQHYHRKTALSINRVESILKGEILGYWGAPSIELLQAYEKEQGFNFTEFYNNASSYFWNNS
jgi:hypothetical protein